MIRALTSGAILVLVIGCSGRRPPPGELHAVSPAAFDSAFDGALAIDGSGFAPRVRVDFDRPSGSELSTEYRAWLVQDGVERALTGVTRMSADRLEANVARGTPPGTWTLRVVDPFGRTLLLDAAVTVTAECTDDAACSETGPCRAAGRCEGSVCEYEDSPAGTACDDGDLCTTGTEQCDGEGRCVAEAEVTCGAAPSCHQGPGVCDPSTGTCVYTPSAAGSSCSDGEACTIANEACDGTGQCVSGEWLACESPGVCGVPGTGSCDSGTGACEYQQVSCTTPPNTQCFDAVGSCTEPDGCSYTARSGASCDDGNSCTDGDACSPSGACAGEWNASRSGCGANLPPSACVTVSPRGTFVDENVTIDARCSTDSEETTATLRMRLDYDADGTWDRNELLASGQPQVWNDVEYKTPGLYRVQVQVKDSVGSPQLVHWAETFVAIAPSASALFEVTTADLDEDDSSSGDFDIRSNPRGTGRSLREIILFLNANPVADAVVTFDPSITTLTGDALPSVTASGVTFIGNPGVTLDFDGDSPQTACVDLAATGIRWIGIGIDNCGIHPLQMKSDGVQVAESRFTPFGTASPAVKIQSINGGTFGPRNVLEGWTSGTAFELKAPNVKIVRNVFRNNEDAIAFNKFAGTLIEGNTFHGHSGTVIQVPTGADDTTIRFNTFVDSGGTALSLHGSANQVVQNNLFVNTGGYAISAPAGTVSAEPNGFFESGGGHLSWGTPGPTSVAADPLFVDRASGDFRLRPGSPMVDGAVSIPGVDVNGSKLGEHDGAAPDFGAYESPF